MAIQTIQPRPALEQAVACRACGHPLGEPFLDLGMMPLVNSYRSPERLAEAEPFFPLRVQFCERCYLVQLEHVACPDQVFSEYAYFSSYSDSWLRHARQYCHDMVRRLGLTPEQHVVEIASNDGYLLQHFVPFGIPVLGIEPAANVAAVAREKGIETLVAFFGEETARRLRDAGKTADLLVANNVLGHVPRPDDFLAGVSVLLEARGVATFEFPHLLRLVVETQFDTIYHEHVSYLSLHALDGLLAACGLVAFDVEELPTHGGSLRVHVCHAGRAARAPTPAVEAVREHERAAGVTQSERLHRFAADVVRVKCGLLEFLSDARRQGLRSAAYGAAAKGTVLLNYCGVGREFVEFVVDRSPHKQGRFVPGTLIPIRDPSVVFQERPDLLLILPWNLREEIMQQMSGIRSWGGHFVVPVPEVQVHA